MMKTREMEEEEEEKVVEVEAEEDEDDDDDSGGGGGEGGGGGGGEEVKIEKWNEDGSRKRSNIWDGPSNQMKKFRPPREKDVFELMITDFPEYNLYTEGKNATIKLRFKRSNSEFKYVATCRLESKLGENKKETTKMDGGIENNRAEGRFIEADQQYEFVFENLKFTRSTGGRIESVKFSVFLDPAVDGQPLAECVREIKIVSNSTHFVHEQGYRIFVQVSPTSQGETQYLPRKRGPKNKKEASPDAVSCEALLVEINNHFDRENKSRRKLTIAELESLCGGKTVTLRDFSPSQSVKREESRHVWSTITRALAIAEMSDLFDQGFIRFCGKEEPSPMKDVADGFFRLRFGSNAEDGTMSSVHIDRFGEGRFYPYAKWTTSCKGDLTSFIGRSNVLQSVLKLEVNGTTFTPVDKAKMFPAGEPPKPKVFNIANEYPLIDDVDEDGMRK
jgi:hypothetical protein